MDDCLQALIMLIKFRPEYKKSGIVIVLNTINAAFIVNK
jgi:hypothetical protein